MTDVKKFNDIHHSALYLGGLDCIEMIYNENFSTYRL